KIKYSISAMINIEKRPIISIQELNKELVTIYQKELNFNGGFFETFRRNNRKIKVEVYSATWNRAYITAVAHRIVENCYRNVAVNLLDRMVEKLLEMTIDSLNKTYAEKEKNKINQ